MAKRERKSAPEQGTPAGAMPPVRVILDERPILVVTANVGRGAEAGGWGFVICYPGGQEIEGAGAEREASTHRVALLAVIRALERLGPTEPAPVRIVTSSRHTVDGASGKAERRVDLDLWARLDSLVQGRRIAWEWEPEETMYFQDRAAELATLALRRGARG